MRSQIYIVILLFYCLPIYSQGSWNIGYIGIDEVDNELLGKTVSLDLTNKTSLIPSSSKIAIRRILNRIDTCEIEIDGSSYQFLERRSIYVDHGAFNDQYLESIPGDSKQVIRIYAGKIINISDNKIQLMAMTKEGNPIRAGWMFDDSFTLKTFWIKTEMLDGFLIEI